MLKDESLSVSEQEDVFTLMHGMFATQLPPLLDEVFNKDSLTKLIEEIVSHPKKTLFKINDTTHLVDRLDKGIHPPEYIFGDNWAAESVKFFTLKADDSWRPMAIPNIKHSLMFTYNSLMVAETSLNHLYSKTNRLEGKTSHSESPIIGRDGLFSAMLYDVVDEQTDEAIGFIGYDQTNNFFEESKLHRLRIEATYPYILQIDLSKFFENIYTHLLAHINLFGLPSSLEKSDPELKSYLKWIDEYNQKINDNHTKGIIQGPISSKITSELLQLSLDQQISNLLEKKKLKVTFTRYVDDYRFFGKNITDLEIVKNDLIKIFRDHELSFNENKIKLYKGFEIQKQAHFENYTRLGSILHRHKRISFNFKNYLRIHDTLAQMLQDNDIPTLKAVLTVLKNKVVKGLINFNNDQIVLSLLEFLVKTAYVLPLVSMQVYKLIDAVLNSVSSKTKRKCWDRLFSEFDYVRANFSDTDLEVWYFYVLTIAGVSRETGRVITRYLKSTEDLSPLLLCVMIKRKSKKANTRIAKSIIRVIDDWATVSQTKWWLPLSKLWISLDGHIDDNNIRKLFISNNGSKIQWDKLGIIEFLRLSTLTAMKSQKNSQPKTG